MRGYSSSMRGYSSSQHPLHSTVLVALAQKQNGVAALAEVNAVTATVRGGDPAGKSKRGQEIPPSLTPRSNESLNRHPHPRSPCAARYEHTHAPKAAVGYCAFRDEPLLLPPTISSMAPPRHRIGAQRSTQASPAETRKFELLSPFCRPACIFSGSNFLCSFSPTNRAPVFVLAVGLYVHESTYRAPRPH
jgi:hypothetical protein